jgi:hypothetical protein
MAPKTAVTATAKGTAAREALTLVVGPAKNRVEVHRPTLIAASPVFRDLIASCPDALGGVPLPEDDAAAWALLAGLLQPLCPGLRAITHANSKGVLELVHKYDVRGALALLDHHLAVLAPALFAALPRISSSKSLDFMHCRI